MVIGFSSGQVEVRKHKSGEIVHTVNIEDAGAIAKVFYYDYRMAGEKQVVVVTTSGIIKGFSVTTNLKQYDITQDADSKEASEKQLELSRRKIELQNQL